MDKICNIDWIAILKKEAVNIAKDYWLRVTIDETIVLEAGRLIEDNLAAIGLIQPNVAKIAGQVAFWIRKLKPLSISNGSPNKLITINELAALKVGLYICNLYKDDNSKPVQVKLPPRIFTDWVKSFHYHSHSPHSSMISFELLMCEV